jgi:PHD/YefM family antitoxin component YafN of YafNO toxin-antitoxin module
MNMTTLKGTEARGIFYKLIDETDETDETTRIAGNRQNTILISEEEG